MKLGRKKKDEGVNKGLGISKKRWDQIEKAAKVKPFLSGGGPISRDMKELINELQLKSPEELMAAGYTYGRTVQLLIVTFQDK